MANEEHLAILRQGVEAWNAWREANPEMRPDLREVDLKEANFSKINLSMADISSAFLLGADFSGADLSGADLSDTNLSEVDLRNADLTKAYLWKVDLSRADLRGADLGRAKLNEANLSGANLSEAALVMADLQSADLHETNFSGARLSGADLRETRFRYTKLSGADFSWATLDRTNFTGVDFRIVKGLDQARHLGPSEISISTLYRSEGQIPETFLRDCGMPDSLIEYIPSLIGALQPIQYYSCFISYSSANEEFARRLHGRMQQAGLRVWFAPEELKAGHKLYDQIDEAIRIYDKLIIVLSEASIRSGWVETELRKALQKERRENRRTLFPIRLVDYTTLESWRLPDSSSGKDLAEEVRGYFVPDFSQWKEHDAFEAAFARLLADLKISTEAR